MFLVPDDTTGKAFVTQLAHLLQSLADGSAIETLLKALLVMPALLMQNTNVDSKLDSLLLCSCLQQHLDLWLEVEFMALFMRGRTCMQDHNCLLGIHILVVMISTVLGDSPS